ncbi:MAG: GspE/PulE family protein [Chromatiales bacterium]
MGGESTDRARTERRLQLKEVLSGLVVDGILGRREAQRLLKLHQQGTRQDLGIHPLVWLGGKHLRSPALPGEELGTEWLTAWLARHTGQPYLRIDPLKIDVDAVTGVISHAYAQRFKILPVVADAGQVTFATCEPYVREWERELRHVLRREIRRVIANPLDIARYQDEFYGLSHSIRRVTQRGGASAAAGIGNLEALVELGKAGKLDANDQAIVHIVDWLLQYAFDQRASDIHLEPRREHGNIRFRIDGMLTTVYQMPGPILGAVTARIKALGRMDIVDKRRPQDGRVKTRTPQGQEVELRLSTMPTAFGEKLVMRIFDPQVVVRGLDALGFQPREAALWQELTDQPHGMILVTGPTGSGKTTTLYSTLKQLARPELNLCTIEDPIEMVSASLNQMQVHPGIGLDFAAGVRTLMRQDPDIIMVGEIRDLETAHMAIQAALTGHLVLSTLHTNDTASAIVRLLDIGAPYYLIAATLLGVVAQRLVRTLCPHCKVPARPDLTTWETLVRPWKLPPPEQVYRAKGCLECRNTGFLGRVGVYEMLRITPEIRSLLSEEYSAAPIREQAYRQGTEPLRVGAARKVAQGVTTVEEALRVTPALGTL